MFLKKCFHQGLNIYDAAVRNIALCLLGEEEEAAEFMQATLTEAKTFQFPSIRADAPCNGEYLEWSCFHSQI